MAVQIVERWIMARLRHQSFFTLFSLNQAIRFLLEDLNQRPFKKLPGSRASQFEQLDKPALSGVNYLVRFATTMMAGWVVLLFTLSSLLKLLLSPVAFPL